MTDTSFNHDDRSIEAETEVAPRASTDPSPLVAGTPLVLPNDIRLALFGIFAILAFGAIYLAKALLLPIALALVLTLTLSPVVRYFGRRRVPEFASAAILVFGLAGVFAVSVYYLSGPIQGWVNDAPEIGYQIQAKLSQLRAPVEAAREASAQLENMVAADDPSAQKVVLQQSGLLTDAASGVVSFVATASVTIVLLLFLLASGRLFYEKLVRLLPSLVEKKRALRIAYTVEEEVSKYLLTISTINIALGAIIAVAMWLVGMPNPILWGVMATLFNFVPYVGALCGLLVVWAVALITFDTVGHAMLAAGLFLGLTTLEGQLLTPAVVGRRLEMNTVAVFLSVALWGWLWGVPGALIAVPLLVCLRVFCEHFNGLAMIGEFIAAAPPKEDL